MHFESRVMYRNVCTWNDHLMKCLINFCVLNWNTYRQRKIKFSLFVGFRIKQVLSTIFFVIIADQKFEQSFVWDPRTEVPCHSRFGTIKVPSCLKLADAEPSPRLYTFYIISFTNRCFWQILIHIDSGVLLWRVR